MSAIAAVALATTATTATTSTVRAAEPTFHATAEVTAEYNDNLLAAPDEPPADQPVDGPLVAPRIADAIIRHTAGLAMLYDTPRVRAALTYSHPITFYLRHPGADSSADTAAAEGRFELSDLDTLTGRLTFNRFNTSLSTLQAADETPIEALRSGGSTVFTLGLAQGYVRNLSDTWSVVQTGTGGLSLPASGGGGLVSSMLAAGPELKVEDHAFALLPSMTYTQQLGAEDPQILDRQVIVGGQGRWSWRFAPPAWSFTASAGAVAALQGGDTHVEPVGDAAARYVGREVQGALLYERGYTPNVLTGRTYVADRVTLRGSAPIVEEQHVGTRAGVGFAHSRLADLVADTASQSVSTWVADVAIGWYPDLYPHIELRYQYTNQLGAPGDQVLLPSFERNLIGLQVSYMFPPLASLYPRGEERRLLRPAEEPPPEEPTVPDEE